MLTIVFGRHGETDYNLQERVQGHADIPLNEKGRRQAAQLVQDLKGIPFDVILTSDLQRASYGAELHAQQYSPHLVPLQSAMWRERNLGDHAGKTLKEIAYPLLGLEGLTHHALHCKCPNGETESQFSTRITAALNEAYDLYKGHLVMVHMHGGVIPTVIEITEQHRRRDANDIVHGNGHGSYLEIKRIGGALVATKAHIKVPSGQLARIAY